MAPRSQNIRGGFTLLEVLVAITLLAMISSIVFGTFFYTINNAEQLEKRALLSHTAGFILEAISRSISSTYVPYVGTYAFEDTQQSVFVGMESLLKDVEADSLSAFTMNPRFGGGMPGGEISYVQYVVEEADDVHNAPEWVEDENNPLILICNVEPLLALSDDLDDMDAQSRFWMLNINSLNFEYFDGSKWLEEWDFETQGILPGAVKVELELADSEGEIHSYTTIARVHVNGLIEEPLQQADIDQQGDIDYDNQDSDAGNDDGADDKDKSQPIFPEMGDEVF